MATESEITTETNQLLFAASVTPDLARWAEAFITAKRSEGLSRKTLAIYAAALQTFTGWAGLRGLSAVEAITANDLRTFMLWLAQEGRNPGGQHICFRVLRTFLKWYGGEVEPIGWRNPIDKLKPPKLPETPLKGIDLPDVSRLLEAAEGKLMARDRAIVLSLIDLGIRANELLSLDIKDFDFAGGGVLIRHGKGSRIRTVYASQKTRRIIRAWLRERGNTSPDSPLFANDSGGRLTYGGLRQIIRRLADRAGIKEPALHSFRRSYCLSMLRAGCDLVSLSRLMGHSDLTLLRRYSAQTGEDLRQAAERYSPADRV